MTRKKGKAPQRTRNRNSNRDNAKDRDIMLEKSDMCNDRFAAYYKAQQILSEEEWDEWMESLKEPLPTTFRVAGSRLVAQELNSIIQSVYVPSIRDTVFEGEQVIAPKQIPWYPEGLAWQFNVSKKVLRKSPEFKKFHSFLVYETDVGNISRQEAVSMIPPLLLDVEPHHFVLDMCAAPGSKTAQILEAIHANDTATTTSIPSGLVIANDSDQKRAHMLIHQSQRLPSPTFMVTNLDASIYPTIKVKLAGRSNQEVLLFDRILCDVPCSGDGTLRKNIDIWKRWSPRDGNGLHGLQLRILERAMKLLKPEGKIVYSTCSMNPIENEAVIAVALQQNQDFELVDVSDRLPGLIRRPGLTSWVVTHEKDAHKLCESYEELNGIEPHPENFKISRGHFPPENALQLGLQKCLRLYSHLQDTGGFFVAVLRRKANHNPQSKKREATPLLNQPEHKRPRTDEFLPAQERSQTNIITHVQVDGLAAISDQPFKENPYTFLPPDDPGLLACIERLSLTSDFPSSNVLVRNPTGENARALYLANDAVKSVIVNNDYSRIRLAAAGTKVFIKQESGKGLDAQFRVLGESVSIALPYLEPSVIMNAELSSLQTMVEDYYPKCSLFEEPFRSAIEARNSGCHIVRFKLDQEDATLPRHNIILPIWKSNVSLSLMIDKKAKSALSLRIFGQDITVAGKEAKEQQKAKAARAQQA